ncbi:MAG: hypothetical protein KKD32_03720 [Proteobacteria bacterium]|nr:hypothetical protein [Pseudomonadota bacterium]MBU1586269.1 hypothetical protein [Pseudomonadota bacterium]MBU2453165.1 hypothetical protein [Pseudomonadota bacterium]MBU2630804.1 hypothetical protein [Pseudomonadota bacterium]
MDELKTTYIDESFLGNPLKTLILSRETQRMLLCVTFSIAIGIMAWDSFLSVAIFLPVVWVKAPTKMTAWLIGLGYHLAASRGLIFGIPVFFGSTVFYGIALWLMAGLIQSLPYFFCSYVRNPYLAIVLLFFALTLPPVGIVGWANPLTAAGVIFPGTGFAGLFLSLCLIWLIVWLHDKGKAFVGIWVMLIVLLPLVIGPTATVTIQIKGSTTNFTGNPSNLGDKFKRDYQKFIKTYNQYSGSAFKTLVLPETTAGIWFESTKQLWARWQRDLKPDQSIILSALLPENKGSLKTYNALIEMKKDNFKVLYKARQSVPVAMWRPWANDDVKINWFDCPVFDVAWKKATALICYEAYLTWPVLQSFLSGDPEIILFVSNHWWSKDTSLLSIQKTCVNAWARLFNAQLISAVNS